jgi:single-stranded DNA-binding protein
MVNDIKLEGNAGGVPETKHIGDHYLLKFGLCVHFGKNFEKKTWVNVEAWNDAARAVKEKDIQKGEKIIVHGTYKASEYNGKTYPCIQVWKADDITFPKRDDNHNQVVDEEEVPF